MSYGKQREKKTELCPRAPGELRFAVHFVAVPTAEGGYSVTGTLGGDVRALRDRALARECADLIGAIPATGERLIGRRDVG